MIIDLPRFITQEKPYWTELEGRLKYMEEHPEESLPLQEISRLHYLYRRASSDLGKIITFSAEPEIRLYLETLVSRAYSEVHETRQRSVRFSPWIWLSKTLPSTFRRHIMAFSLSCLITLAGVIFGSVSLAVDPDSRHATMAFGHDLLTPTERVRNEEKMTNDHLSGQKASFSAYLMQNNIRVSLLTLALGMTFGLGSIVVLFSNGVTLGAISADYILDGQSVFLAGWLLPHGSTEIPAILIAGQASFVLASALIGWGRPLTLRQRLREIAPDLTTLIGAIILLLIMAGLVESFFSQYHEPLIPYSFKIIFGTIQLMLLTFYLSFAGRSRTTVNPGHSNGI